MHTKKKFPVRIKVLVLMLIYKNILDFSYIYYINPTYFHEGFIYSLNLWKLVEGYIFSFFIILVLPLDERKPSTIALNSITLLMILPILSIYGLKNESRIYAYGIFISFLITILLVKILPKIKIKVQVVINQFLPFVFFGISLIVYSILLYLNGVPSLEIFDFNKVYNVRFTVNYGFNFMGYLVNWQGIIINPFLMVIYLQNNKKVLFVLVAFLQILLYLITSHKSYLLYTLMVLFLVYLIKRKNCILIFISGLCSLIFAGLILSYFNITKWVASLSIYRTLFLPAQISFQYYEYFSLNGLVLLSHSIFRLFYATPIYEVHPIRIIGQIYYYDNFPNTGYLGDAYMNFGVYGMIIFSIIFGILLKTVDSLANTKHKKLISGVFMVILAVYLTNVALLTTLLTGGMLFFMLVLWLYNETDFSKSL